MEMRGAYLQMFSKIHRTLCVCSELPPSVYRFDVVCDELRKAIEISSADRFSAYSDISVMPWMKLSFELLLESPHALCEESDNLGFSPTERTIMSQKFHGVANSLIDWLRLTSQRHSIENKRGLRAVIKNEIRAPLIGVHQYRGNQQTAENLIFAHNEVTDTYDFNPKVIEAIHDVLPPVDEECRETILSDVDDLTDKISAARPKCAPSWLARFEKDVLPYVTGINEMLKDAETWITPGDKRDWQRLWALFKRSNLENPWLSPDKNRDLRAIKSLYDALKSRHHDRVCVDAPPTEAKAEEKHMNDDIKEVLQKLSKKLADEWSRVLVSVTEMLAELLVKCQRDELWGLVGNPAFVEGLNQVAENKYCGIMCDEAKANEFKDFARFSSAFAAFYRGYVEQHYPNSEQRPKWIADGDRFVDAIVCAHGVECQDHATYYLGARQLAGKVAKEIFKSKTIDLMYVGEFPPDRDDLVIPEPPNGGEKESLPTSSECGEGLGKCRLSVTEDDKNLTLCDSLAHETFVIKKTANAYEIIKGLYKDFLTGTKQTQTSKKGWKNAFMHGDANRFNSLEIFKEPKTNPTTKKPMGNLKSNKWRLRTDEELKERLKELGKRK